MSFWLRPFDLRLAPVVGQFPFIIPRLQRFDLFIDPTQHGCFAPQQPTRLISPRTINPYAEVNPYAFTNPTHYQSLRRSQPYAPLIPTQS